ncbi:MAG: ClpX C4-type zinc finger protein, partial [Oscillospiraceae bacterium]|nr:ClpX C4-type zinc finger protein [Oscillospiraceae bacterium]
MARNEGKTMRCSFCGRPQGEVDKLFSGNGSYICDECVRLCMEILE